MQSSFFRIASGIASILLLGALVLVISITLRTDHPAAVVPTPRPQLAGTATTPSVTQAADAVAPSIPLTTTQPISGTRNSSGANSQTIARTLPLAGFNFDAPADFGVTTGATSATLTGQAAGGLTPVFLLSGGESSRFVSNPAAPLDEMFAEFVAFFAEQDNFVPGETEAFSVDNAPARTVELTSQDPMAPFAGRIVMAQPAAGRLFVMTGIAPLSQWQTHAAGQFAAVLDSVTFTADGNAATAVATLLAPTATPTLTPVPTLPPTPTPIPASQPLPTPAAQTGAPEEAILANSNYMRDLTLTSNTLWTASEGGIVAWNRRSDAFVRFTPESGLALNHFNTTTYCPLPGLGVVFGSPYGLQIFDARNGTWNTLTSANSAMSFDDVSIVHCETDAAFLLVGYRQHGFDIFDATTNTWTHVDKNNGLANDIVEQVAVVGARASLRAEADSAQQQAVQIWVSSGFGLSVLQDGRSRTYTPSNSPLTGNQINALAVAPDDAVWIVAPDALHRVQNERWTTFAAADITGSAFPSAPLTAITFDQAGFPWIGSAGGEVCRFMPEEQICGEFFAGEAGMPVGVITGMGAADGDLYYTTDGQGAGAFDGRSWRTLEVPGEPLLDNRVRSLAQDSNGFIWIAGEAGLQQLSPANFAVSRMFTLDTGLPIEGVQVLATDVVGGVWVGGLGLAYFDGETWRVFGTDDGLAGSVVQAITRDNQRRTWIGTKTGLSIWNGDTFFNLTQANGLPNDNITALLADGETMWIGSNGGGLYAFARNQLRIFNQQNANLPDDVITALGLAENGDVLVGTNAGLARLDGAAATVEAALIDAVPPNAVTGIATRDAQIWVGSNEGVYYFDGATWSHDGLNRGLPSLSIRALLPTRNDALWIGGERGGIVQRPTGQ